MKVWLLTQGEYSDYTEIGVFSSLENAKKAIEIYKNNDSWSKFNDPIEMEVDALIQNNLIQFWVFSDGIRTDVNKDSRNIMEYKINEVHWMSYRGGYSTLVRAENEEHAVKIASDLIAQFKALNRIKEL